MYNRWNLGTPAGAKQGDSRPSVTTTTDIFSTSCVAVYCPNLVLISLIRPVLPPPEVHNDPQGFNQDISLPKGLW